MDTDGIPPSANPAPGGAGWSSAWPDLLACAAALAMAWLLQWQVRDLVWSLWLSSLLVGYAMIVWTIFGPVLAARRAGTAVGAVYWIGGLFLLAFFTFHFGMFHFVHSVFLNLFFPVLAEPSRGFTSPALYLHVFREYWPFVLVAAVAERAAFQRPFPLFIGSDGSRTASGKKNGDAFMRPYRNVVRMHLLIFFFAFAHFARLESYYVYAAVYAVYFFPWRLLRRKKDAAAGAPA